MNAKSTNQVITIFTPSFADESSTNAQDLTVKEIVVRLPPELFRVIMVYEDTPDPRIAFRKNTKLLRYYKHGNTVQLLARFLVNRPNVYFYPRTGPLDRMIFTLSKKLRPKIAVVAHILMVMNDATGRDLIGRSVVEGDAVLANSVYVAETIRQKFGVKPKIIYDGIDRRFFFPSKEPRSRKNSTPLAVLYAGSFQSRKRVEFVIQQAARWPDAVFRVAGKGETEPACRALAAQLNCRNVEFLGHLLPTQLGDEMRRADVFFFPSVLEGHPQVLGQAAACGVPAVAMNVYHPEYLVNGETGFLADSDTEMAEKLDVLMHDASLRQSMASAASRHAMKFDWDNIARQWAQVITQAAALAKS